MLWQSNAKSRQSNAKSRQSNAKSRQSNAKSWQSNAKSRQSNAKSRQSNAKSDPIYQNGLMTNRTKKRTPKSDPIYKNRLVNMLINRILKHGKKSLAYRILYRAMKKIQKKTEKNPLVILRQAIRGVTPKVVVKARRKSGSTYQVPIKIKPAKGKVLAIRWLLGASRKRTGQNMDLNLSYELIDAAKKKGNAIRKKEEIHRMAESNRAFAHYR